MIPTRIFQKNHNKFTLCGTGILPVAKNDTHKNFSEKSSTINSLFVEQASCLLLKMIPTRIFQKNHNKFTLCGTGILPVAKNDTHKNFSEKPS